MGAAAIHAACMTRFLQIETLLVGQLAMQFRHQACSITLGQSGGVRPLLVSVKWHHPRYLQLYQYLRHYQPPLLRSSGDICHHDVVLYHLELRHLGQRLGRLRVMGARLHHCNTAPRAKHSGKITQSGKLNFDMVKHSKARHSVHTPVLQRQAVPIVNLKLYRAAWTHTTLVTPRLRQTRCG